jgi:hypothetical protein
VRLEVSHTHVLREHVGAIEQAMQLLAVVGWGEVEGEAGLAGVKRVEHHSAVTKDGQAQELRVVTARLLAIVIRAPRQASTKPV